MSFVLPPPSQAWALRRGAALCSGSLLCATTPKLQPPLARWQVGIMSGNREAQAAVQNPVKVLHCGLI